MVSNRDYVDYSLFSEVDKRVGERRKNVTTRCSRGISWPTLRRIKDDGDRVIELGEERRFSTAATFAIPVRRLLRFLGCFLEEMEPCHRPDR